MMLLPQRTLDHAKFIASFVLSADAASASALIRMMTARILLYGFAVGFTFGVATCVLMLVGRS